jgi:hypothetical protein
MKTANDNTSTTPITDAVTTALAAQLPPELRWQLEGWAQHLREARHANHAANAWAKHMREFGRISREAEFVVVARCADFGVGASVATVLLRERIEARAAKAA